jgi:hypothetical protein
LAVIVLRGSHGRPISLEFCMCRTAVLPVRSGITGARGASRSPLRQRSPLPAR